MKCPDEKVLIAFIDGEMELSPSVARHVEGCELCRERIDRYEVLKRSVTDQEPVGVNPDEVRRFVASLPELRQPYEAVGRRRMAFAAALMGMLIVGVAVGRGAPSPDRIAGTRPEPGLVKVEAISALHALQELKLAANRAVFDPRIRTVESVISKSLGENGELASLRLVRDGEDSLAANDLITAASSFKEAVKLGEGTFMGPYARLQHARVLTELRYYDGALREISNLSRTSEDSTVNREARHLLATCQIALGDKWRAAMTLEDLASQGIADGRLAELAIQAGDLCYQETRDLEMAQRCYSVWAEAAPDTDAQYRKAKETRARLALLEESADDRWEPLMLYLRAEDAYPEDAQNLYARLVGAYPENSLADSAFVKWYGLEQARKARMEPTETRLGARPVSDMARWQDAAEEEADAPDEIRAYALLKIADHLHAQLDGVEQVVVAYSEVVEGYPWTPTARIARDRADIVRDTIERKSTTL
jgi:tetratricopeptide (TPR) repeat protein